VIVVAYLGYLFFVSGLEHSRSQRTLLANFDKMLEEQRAPIGGLIPERTPVFVLEVPSIGTRQVVVEGTDARILQRGPGHLRNSPLPGQAGNSVIAGRRIAYGGPFQFIGRLKRGDEIVAITGQGRSVYEVTKVASVGRNDPDPVSPTSGNQMTLVTSTPQLIANRRLVAVAILQTDPFETPALRANQIRSDELGLQGDSTNALALLVWVQLLLVASCGAVYLHRRWARWPTYLVAAPVIALLLVLVFDSLTPVLPSTL
jgi:sortase A